MNDLHFKLVQEENNNLMAFFQHTCAGKVLLHFSVGPSTKDVSSNCTDGYPRWNQDKKGPNRCFSWTFFSVFFFFCPYLEGPCPRQDSMAVIWGPMGQGACKSPYLQGSTKLKGLKPLKLYFSVKELHHLFFFYRNDASSFRGISFLKQTQSWTCTDISVWSTCSRFSLFLKRWISLNSSVNFIVPTQHCTAYSWMS